MEEDAQDRVCVCGVGGAWKFMLSEPRFPQTCMCLCRPVWGFLWRIHHSSTIDEITGCWWLLQWEALLSFPDMVGVGRGQKFQSSNHVVSSPGEQPPTLDRGHVGHLSRQTQPWASLPAITTWDPGANRKSRQAPGLPRMCPVIRDWPGITCLEHIRGELDPSHRAVLASEALPWWGYPWSWGSQGHREGKVVRSPARPPTRAPGLPGWAVLGSRPVCPCRVHMLPTAPAGPGAEEGSTHRMLWRRPHHPQAWALGTP